VSNRPNVVSEPPPLPRTLVGSLEQEPGGGWRLLPFDARLRVEVEVVRGAERAAAGDWAVVDLEPGGGVDRVRGRVVELLGPLTRPGTDVKVVLRHFGIPEPYPEEAVRLARQLPADPPRRDYAGREDLRRHLLVTIDGPSARDFDDAVSVRQLPDGGFQVSVHIADVAHYVTEDSPIDREAFRRGTSVYYPERAIPMLPEELSNGLCSLRPHVPRLALSVFLELAPDGEVRSRRFAETVIRSAARLTYEQVRRLLEDDEVPEGPDAAWPAGLEEMLHDARAVMEVLHRRRLERGSLDFDLPEGDVVLDTDGETIGIRPGQRNVAHRIVEELMIAANEAVASEMVARGLPALYRVHHRPDAERLTELRDLLAPLGVPLAGDLERLPPRALQEVLRLVEGRPEEAFVGALVLRSQQRAIYSPECEGHYALASPRYLHFTSPIRRYPDLLVHRQLKALLRGEAGGGEDLRRRLPEMAEHLTAVEKRAEQSERELLQWKKVRFLGERRGVRFQGRVTGVQPFGLFVQLDDYFVDGFVPVAALGDDFWVYERESHRLVGSKTKRAFRLAAAVEVELLGADLRRRSLDLKLLRVDGEKAGGQRRPPGVRPGSGMRPGSGARPASGERQRRKRRR
jgi:ribonuclease R